MSVRKDDVGADLCKNPSLQASIILEWVLAIVIRSDSQ
jgi:hypothetical protein